MYDENLDNFEKTNGAFKVIRFKKMKYKLYYDLSVLNI